MPPDLVETLKSLGVFRMFVPRSHSGLELDIPAGLEVVRALSRIDGSVGWIAMIGSGTALLPSLLPRDVYEEVYRNGPDTILASSVLPSGTAEAVAGGWKVKGRWAFVSGCQHADWISGLCVMTENGKPLPGSATQDGPPLVRACIRPASEWEIEDTWYVGGLKGTGSNHVSLSERVVPAAYFLDRMGTSCLPGPLYQAIMQFIPFFHCAFAVGVAEGALDALVALARTGRQQLWAATPLRDSETFQGAVGRVAVELDVARAFFQAQIASQWRRALAGTLKDEIFFTRATAVRNLDYLGLRPYRRCLRSLGRRQRSL